MQRGEETCPFCKRIEAGEYDIKWLGGVTFEPLNPVTPGHRLFVSTYHEDPLEDPYKWTRAWPRPHGVDGVLPLFYSWRNRNNITEEFNLILNAGESASQSIEHLHMHYIPRRPGDGLILPWTNQEK